MHSCNIDPVFSFPEGNKLKLSDEAIASASYMFQVFCSKNGQNPCDLHVSDTLECGQQYNVALHLVSTTLCQLSVNIVSFY